MFDGNKKLLYIGKAKNLRRRVYSYFSKQHGDLKTLVLVSLVHHVDIILTQTEKEALILENQLIKKNQPRFNISLKDDKNYPFIKLTADPFPRVIITRNKTKEKHATYFGPYPSVGSTKYLKKMILDLFPIRDCKQKITLDRPQPKCILLDIQKCIGPCIHKDRYEAYHALVDNLKKFLSGKNTGLLRQLKTEMLEASESQDYEKAALIRDKINRIKALGERQYVDLKEDKNVLILVADSSTDHHYLLIQEIKKGKLLFQHGFYDSKKNVKNIHTFIEQSTLSCLNELDYTPKSIICNAIVQTAISAIPIPSIMPQKGEKRQLLLGAKKNTQIALDRLALQALKEEKKSSALSQLQTLLTLPQKPTRIAGFDISHLQGTNIVGSCVVFDNGAPLKKAYKKFIINYRQGISHDPASLRETVARYLTHCLREGEPLPQLLLIDGGKPQLSFAYESLKELELDTQIAMVALAKKEELLFSPKSKTPIKAPRNHPGLTLLQHVRDESHRFAVTFQRSKRSKEDLASKLSGIKGIGPKRLNRLYKQFGSLKNILNEAPKTLAKKGQFPIELALDLQRFIGDGYN